MILSMTKFEARKKYKLIRKKLEFKELQNLSSLIRKNCSSLDIWNMKNYHIFFSVPKRNEVDTIQLINLLKKKNKNIIIPKCDFTNNCLESYLFENSTILKENKYGILEPVEGLMVETNIIDVIFLPLLAYDKMGNRVGYGGGFYDKFLKNCNSNVIKVGLSFFDPEPKIDDISEFDVKLDHCITPYNIFSF